MGKVLPNGVGSLPFLLGLCCYFPIWVLPSFIFFFNQETPPDTIKSHGRGRIIEESLSLFPSFSSSFTLFLSSLLPHFPAIGTYVLLPHGYAGLQYLVKKKKKKSTSLLLHLFSSPLTFTLTTGQSVGIVRHVDE